MAGILDVIGRRRLFGANGNLNDRLRMVGVTPWNTNRNPVRMAGGLDSSTQTLAAGISPSAEPVPHQLRFAPGAGQAAVAQIGHGAASELASEQSCSEAAKPGPLLLQRARDTFGDYRRRPDEYLSRPEGQGIGTRMAKGAGRTLVGVPETIADVAAPPETTGEKIAAFMPGGLVLKRAVIDPAIAEERTALQQLKEGRYSEAAGHALAGSLPLVGPWAANLGERAGQRDIAGAAGKAGTARLLPKITGRIARTVGGGMRNAAYRGMIEQPIDASINEGLATSPTPYLQDLRDLRRDLVLQRRIGPDMALQSPLVPLAAGAAGLRPTLRRRLLEVGYDQNH